MVTSQEVERQLKKAGCNYSLWGTTELAQLPNILMDDEKIFLAVNGYYEGGFGMLVVTNMRVLIVDKKPFVLNIEDLRYEMITGVSYGARFILASIHISLPTKTILFESWSMSRLQKAMGYIQQHVMDARNGGSPLPQDWFADKAKKMAATAGSRPNPIIQLARSALRGHNAAELRRITIGERSSQRGINPYTKILPLDRRRRYPAFRSN